MTTTLLANLTKSIPLPSQQSVVQSVFIGMIASVTFAVIDSINFLLIEGPMTKIWEKTQALDEKTIPLVNGAIAGAISILIATYIEEYLKKKYHMFNHPIIHAAGIIVGTIIVIMGYRLYLKLKAIEEKIDKKKN